MARTGLIVRLVTSRGFGFIQPDGDGVEIFFHATAVQGTPFDSLREGQRVEYEDAIDERSARPRAERVHPLP